jgi:hypothetical protein
MKRMARATGAPIVAGRSVGGFDADRTELGGDVANHFAKIAG